MSSQTDTIENRVELAISLFEQGYNCSQSVFMAYADIYNIDKEVAAALSTSFGGGIGRMREMCGAVSGAAMLLGLKYPHLNPSDNNPKDKNYQMVQKLAIQFKSEMGSYICADLLDIEHVPQSPVSAVRNQAYYDTRPCARYVAYTAELIGRELFANK